MTQSNPNDPQMKSPDDVKPPVKKRRRRWPIVLGVIVLLLVLLVALAPTIASMGFVRNIVLGKVNENLNGQVSVDSWSVGWFGGIDAHGVKVTDQSGTILSLDKFTTTMSLFDAVRGKYNLGSVNVDGLRFALKIDEQGKSNFEKLAKPSPSQPSSEKQNQPAGESKLPNVSGGVMITNSGGTIERAGMPDVVAVNIIKGNAKIRDINESIMNALDIGVKIGNGQEGRIALEGSVDVIDNNQIIINDHPDQAAVDEKLTLSDVTLGSLTPFVPGASINKMSGTTGGQLNIKLAKGTGTIDGQIVSKAVQVEGPALKGDRYTTNELAIIIPSTAIALGDVKTVENYRITVGANNTPPIQVKMDQGLVQVRADTTIKSLQNLGKNQAPADKGMLREDLKFDLKQLADLLPHTLGLVEGVKVQQGALVQFAEMQMTPEAAVVKLETALPDGVRGTDKDNRPVNISPITFDGTASALGGGGAIPNLRDLSLVLNSGFATADFKGKTIADIGGTAKGDLAKAQQELGQVKDFGAMKVAGTFLVEMSSKGDVANQSAPLDLGTTATVHDVRVSGLKDLADVNQPWVQMTAKGRLDRDDKGAPKAITGGEVTVRTGNEQNPTIDVYALADLLLGEKAIAVPKWEIRKASFDFVRAQNEFGGLMGLSKDPNERISFTSGVLTVNGKGSFDGASNTARIESFTATPTNLTVQKGQATLLQGYTTKLAIAGNVRQSKAGTEASLDQLDLNDDGKLLTIRNAGKGPITVTLPEKGTAQASAKVDLAANLAAINRIVKSMSGGASQIVARSQAGEVTSGTLTGTVDAGSTTGGIQLTGALKVNELSITTNDRPIEHENMTIVLQATTNGDLSEVKAQQLAVNSTFVNAAVSDATLQLKTGSGKDAKATSGIDMIRQANVTANVTALDRLMYLANAFSPPTTQPVGQKPVDPIVWTGGTINSKLSISRDSGGALAVNVPEISGNNVSFRRGQAVYSAQPFTLKAAAAVTSANGTIQNLEVRDLAANSDLANVSLSQPIVVQNLNGLLDALQGAAGTQATGTAKGAIHIAGDLAKTKQLLDALQGAKSGEAGDLAGKFDATQNFNTQGRAIVSTGQVNVTDFRAGTGKEVFSEPQIKVANDVTLDLGSDALNIKNVSLTMQTSKALDVAITGIVHKLSSERTLENVKANVNADTAKVWQVVRPLLSPQTQKDTAEYKIAGTLNRTFTVSGAYPAGKPFNEAIRGVTADGGIGLDSFQGSGFDVQQLAIDLKLVNGKLTFSAPRGAPEARPAADVQGQPAPDAPSVPINARINGGTATFTGLEVDLTTNPPRLNAKDVRVFRQVALNKVIANNVLGKVSPLFVNPDEAAGVLDVHIVNAQGLALGDLITTRQSGAADVTMSFTQVNLINNFIGKILSVAGGDLGQGKGLQGNIPNAHFSFNNGNVEQHFTFELGRNSLAFDGKVNLQTLQLDNYTITLPAQTLKHINRQLANFQGGLPIALAGRLDAPELRLDQSIGAFIKKNLTENPAGVLGNILGNNKNQPDRNEPPPGAISRPPARQEAAPDAQPKSNDVGNIIGDILGGKKKDDGNRAAPKQQPPPDQVIGRDGKKAAPPKKPPATKPATKPAPKPAKNPIRLPF